jgi:uncharacterized OB-fold protein
MSSELTLPPTGRSALGKRFTAENRNGGLVLQKCAACGQVQYPPREICVRCLGDALNWEKIDTRGRLLSWTEVSASLEPAFQSAGHWPIGLVRLDAGPRLYAFLNVVDPRPDLEVQVQCRVERGGEVVLIANTPGHAGSLRPPLNRLFSGEDHD